LEHVKEQKIEEPKAPAGVVAKEGVFLLVASRVEQ